MNNATSAQLYESVIKVEYSNLFDFRMYFQKCMCKTRGLRIRCQFEENFVKIVNQTQILGRNCG